MIQASVTFFLLAILAYIFGAYNIAGITLEIGQILLLVFVTLSVVTFLYSVFNKRNIKS